MPDVYYNPSDFNLTPVADIELDNESCSFNILSVWKHKDGSFYYAQDSGCSCPSPFQDYHSIEQLQKLSVENFSELENITNKSRGATPMTIKYFLNAVKEAIDKKD